MSLASKLPYNHAYANGFGYGGQTIPTDVDALTYLDAVATADGAPMEVGIASNIDRFIKACKADNAGIAADPTRTNWDAIKASCILAGARTLNGALTPLSGTDPTNVNNNFTSNDYDRISGLKGDGSSKYLNSNYAYPSDYQNDCHLAVSISALPTTGLCAGYGDAGASGSYVAEFAARLYQLGTAGTFSPSDTTTLGLRGVSRSDPASFNYRFHGTTELASIASSAVTHSTLAVFGRQRHTGTPDNLTDARLAFYSIGTALDLELLDEKVSNLINGLKFYSYTNLNPADYDVDTVNYIVDAYESGGSL